jgi:hypothetical protein
LGEREDGEEGRREKWWRGRLGWELGRERGRERVTGGPSKW